MSNIRRKLESLISFLPLPIAWVPNRLFRAAIAMGKWFSMICMMLYFAGFHIFSSRDMFGVPKEVNRQRDREWKLYRKEEDYWRVQAIKGNKRRRLSFPLRLDSDFRASSDSGWWDWKITKLDAQEPQEYSDQQQSPLGRLPEELRRMIYAHLVAGNRLHIQESYKRFGYANCVLNLHLRGEIKSCNQIFPCLARHLDKARRMGDRSTPSTGSRLILSSYEGFKIKPTESKSINSVTPRDELLALAKSCRLLYTGYLDELYSTTTFAFTSLRQFQTFSTTIPQHRLAMITSLEFHSELGAYSRDRLDVGWEEVEKSHWRRAWSVIATMPNLRSIHADLRMDKTSTGEETSYSGVHCWMEERIFGPMKLVTVKEGGKFNVVVNWYQSRDFELGDVPFTLVRDLDRAAWSDLLRDREYRIMLDDSGWRSAASRLGTRFMDSTGTDH